MYAAMTAEDTGDYDQLKAAIFQRYNITEKMCRVRFWSVTRAREESYTEMLFGVSRSRQRLSKRQKWENNCKRAPGASEDPGHLLEVSREDLVELQRSDEYLDQVWRQVQESPEGKISRGGFFLKDGVLYRRWVPVGGEDWREVEQLVLPQQCHRAVLELAHSIPLAGHLGKKKTARRVLQRFYWTTLFKDMDEYCRGCAECQKTAPGRQAVAPLVPLPIVASPFERIAMDIVGPLPRSHSGNRFVLVVCDYATRWSEAVPLKSIDAGHVAEELMVLFSRVGVPKEILTDQSSNFTSQLLKEVYWLVSIKPIKTSPYHPQTDGLVERFSQTLKAMLRRTVTDEGRTGTSSSPMCCLPTARCHSRQQGSHHLSWCMDVQYGDH